MNSTDLDRLTEVFVRNWPKGPWDRDAVLMWIRRFSTISFDAMCVYLVEHKHDSKFEPKFGDIYRRIDAGKPKTFEPKRSPTCVEIWRRQFNESGTSTDDWSDAEVVFQFHHRWYLKLFGDATKSLGDKPLSKLTEEKLDAKRSALVFQCHQSLFSQGGMSPGVNCSPEDFDKAWKRAGTISEYVGLDEQTVFKAIDWLRDHYRPAAA